MNKDSPKSNRSFFYIAKRLKSFKYAGNGIFVFFRDEPNGKIHFWAAITVIIFTIIIGASKLEWLFILLAITLVISSEIFNTAMEALADKVEPSIHPQIKLVKDLAAGAVLVCAIFAVAVAIVVFSPKFFP